MIWLNRKYINHFCCLSIDTSSGMIYMSWTQMFRFVKVSRDISFTKMWTWIMVDNNVHEVRCSETNLLLTTSSRFCKDGSSSTIKVSSSSSSSSPFLVSMITGATGLPEVTLNTEWDNVYKREWIIITYGDSFHSHFIFLHTQEFFLSANYA